MRKFECKRKREGRNQTQDDDDDGIEASEHVKFPKLHFACSILNMNPAVKTTWHDTEPGQRTCYTLYKLKNDAEIVELGKEIFEQLHTSLTIRTICSLLLLAYNLKDTEGNSLFGNVSPDLMSEEDIDFSEIRPRRVKTISRVSYFKETLGANVIGRDKRLAMGYSFLAGSYLRLFSKSAEDYGKTEHHLKKGFRSLYGFDLPFDNYHPNLEIVLLIKANFDIGTIKNTLYNLLYAGRVVEDGKSIKDFLYGTHLEMTGLHAVGLFEKCMDAYKVDNHKLASILTMKAFKDELEHIGLIFSNFYSGDEKVRLGMWRYARIFDSMFMSRLQTKRCKYFTASLAYLFHMKVPITPTRNFLKIASLSDMTPRYKLDAKEIAKVAFRLINEDALTGKSA